MGLRDVAGLGEQQRHRVLGSRDDVALRRVDHHHATARRRLDIDVVEADAGSADDEQLIGVLEHLGGDLCGRADDESLRATDVVQQRVEIELHIDLVAGRAEAVEATFGDFFGDKDPGHPHHRYRREPWIRKELNDLFTSLRVDGYVEPTPSPVGQSSSSKSGGSMSYPFLSAEWMDAAKAIREKYADQSATITISVRMNQVITDTPFDDGDIRLYLDTSSGSLVMEPGELETPDLTLTTDYDTAKKIFVDQDQAAGMQAFMAGKIKVQGDMMKMMAMQTSMPQDDVAQTIADEIKGITE